MVRWDNVVQFVWDDIDPRLHTVDVPGDYANVRYVRFGFDRHFGERFNFSFGLKWHLGERCDLSLSRKRHVREQWHVAVDLERYIKLGLEWNVYQQWYIGLAIHGHIG